jgi:undecaprenyl-diphosphatase
VVVFRRDLAALARRALSGNVRELGLLFLGSLPAAVVGLGFQDVFERLFASARAAALGLLVTGAIVWLGERARRRSLALRAEPRELGWQLALAIGCAQAFAILPGVSRSGSTIATALVLGVETSAAARFSFLLSVPAVAGAVLLETPALVRSHQLGPDLGVAVLATFLVGVLALRFLLAFLGRGAFRWCALYCTAVGALALVLL